MRKSKGILLDLDHTLYDYHIVHNQSINYTLSQLSNKFSIPVEELEAVLNKVKKKLHVELVNTASSHNRMLYFQRMFEALNVDSLKYTLEAYNFYWDTFLSLLNYDEGVEEVLGELKRGRKICLITDLTVHIQHRKVQKLKLYKYLDYMVSSEEAGTEKPHPHIFRMALQKLKLEPSDVCMIGDNYKKDITGACNLNIRSFWLNRDGENEKTNELIKEIRSFTELKNYV